MPKTPRVAPAPNRLARERSPYLQQHARNPVDWYPWGEEAFAKARAEDKPLFLSIGYSTCHWCHVMERESFENAEVARLLNQSFVSVKVDREELPDVDQVYMQAVLLMRGQGGWPLTVFLTPEGQPFFGGTYFPPARRGQQIGMTELLPNIAEAWRARRGALVESARKMTEALRQSLDTAVPPGEPSEALLHQAAQQATASFDAAHGGFGEAPKFPRPVELSFLLRYATRTGQGAVRDMVVSTLRHMARGGLRDHLGGGFHRYATDAHWQVPHFEKMLYDQALLAKAYLEAFRATGEADFAAVARDIFAYVLRDLKSPEGGFYTAEDADSEGEEGRFYIWTLSALTEALGVRRAPAFAAAYGATAEGNFEQGTNILHGPLPSEAAAFAPDRAALLARRGQRIRPLRDEKILTGWNGLMIGALAYGAATFDEPAYLTAAEQAAAMLLERLQDARGLLRRYRDGEAKHAGSLEDYAFLIDGLLELYQAGGRARWLEAAQALARRMNERFWDAASGGWFTRSAEEPALIVRAKDFYDGATPSGNATALLANLRLARLTGDASWHPFVEQALRRGAPLAAQAPFGFPQYLTAFDHWLGPSREVTLAGDPADVRLQALARVVHARWLPRTVVAWRGDAAAPAAHVCQGQSCQAPVSDPQQLAKSLDLA